MIDVQNSEWIGTKTQYNDKYFYQDYAFTFYFFIYKAACHAPQKSNNMSGPLDPLGSWTFVYTGFGTFVYNVCNGLNHYQKQPH